MCFRVFLLQDDKEKKKSNELQEEGVQDPKDKKLSSS